MASGGIDSGLLWAHGHDQLQRAFCVDWSGADDDGLGQDATAVRRCSQLLGTPVRFLLGEDWQDDRLPKAGDLVADPAFGLTRSIAAAARLDGCKVLLSGQGGDELFGGYRKHRVASMFDRLRIPTGPGRAAVWALKHLGGPTLSAEYATRLTAALACRSPAERYLRLSSYSDAEDRAKALGCTAHEVSDEVVSARHAEIFATLPPKLSFLRQMMTVDLRVYLPGLGLAYADRAAMEEGVEVRVPLLDLELVEWSMGLPDDLLIRRGSGKWLAKQLAARVLPADVVFRPKRGFGAPVRHVATAGPSSSRGLRQGAYFRRASAIVARHLETVSS
jgi:asparagine synthase (glutamine-hydrolysing)